MCQSDDQFIEVLNRFQTTTHNLTKIPCLITYVYTNLQMNWISFICIIQISQQKNATIFFFENTKGQEYVFDANDQHHVTCSIHFKFKNNLSQIVSLHLKIQVKIGMLVELCVSNCATHDGLLNTCICLLNIVFKDWICFINTLKNSIFSKSSDSIFSLHSNYLTM
jgi:hypothetical protein